MADTFLPPSTGRAPEPLPCPFCGGDPVVYGEDSTWMKLCRVSCDCHIEYHETRSEAVAAWNCRALLPAPDPVAVEAAWDEYDDATIDWYTRGIAIDLNDPRTPAIIEQKKERRESARTALLSLIRATNG